jgi:Secretion system C-terminal sorting domain/Immunoglobulin domain
VRWQQWHIRSEGLAQGGGQGGSCTASTMVLECIANGTNVSYQWYKNNVVLGGSTQSTLSVNSALNTQNLYHCVVTNSCGNKKSNTLIVSCPPLAMIQGNACLNKPKTISANATIIGYEWQKRLGSNCNTGNWSVISGATSGTYTPIIAGSYRCKVTFVGGCMSMTGALCVNQSCPSAPVSNNDFIVASEDPLLDYYNSIDWTTYDPNDIEAATDTITIDENTVLAASTPNSNEEISLAIFPNPTLSTSTIHYTLPELGHVTLTLITPQGTKKVVYDKQQEAGDYQEQLDLEPFAAGLYYLEMAVENKAILVKKVVKL